jgi:mercuric ion binding protein
MTNISNTLKKGMVVLFVLIAASGCYAQQKKSDTVSIKTSAVCDMCKERIEGALAFEKGVKSSTLDLETKLVEVVFNPAKTSPEKLRLTLSKLGYDADDVPANEKAYASLPACCKKDAPKH